MRTDLSHLPERKREELAELVRLVRGKAAVEMIVLYGSYARGDWKEEADLDPERWSGQVSDYDILVIVAERAQAEDALFWKRVGEVVNAAILSAPVRLLVRDLNEVNMAIAEGRYFFRDLQAEGRRLYDSGRFELAEPEALGPETRRRLAQEYFDIWFEAARRFYKTFEWHMADDDLRRAAFNLNQATESAYKCVLLVHTLYTPHEHLLDILGRLAARHGPVFEAIFPQADAWQRHCFEQLDRAYIGCRYHPRFEVTREELDYLAPRVRELLAVTERLCRAELERIQAD